MGQQSLRMFLLHLARKFADFLPLAKKVLKGKTTHIGEKLPVNLTQACQLSVCFERLSNK